MITERLIVILFLQRSAIILATCSEDEDKLMVDIFKGYNNLIQPKEFNNVTMVVHMSLQLILLINVQWTDSLLRWNPVNYGNINTIRVTPEKVWLPDVVLFNNADGQYEVSYYSNVVINNTGAMLWVPPAIYKSSCQIDVQYFPFDEQLCSLMFGSWTYNEEDIIFQLSERGINLDEYSLSMVWDIVEAPATLRRRKSRIEFQIRIRRKPLFYTVVLIVPTVLMAFLSMMVFYLPSGETGEKITLTINVLLSLVVFLLLVSKILPPTSIKVPLMAKYLLFTFLLNIVTILITVIIINVFFRGPATHRMPAWVAKVFLQFLPRVLLMQRPKPPPEVKVRFLMKATDDALFAGNNADTVEFATNLIEFNNESRRYQQQQQQQQRGRSNSQQMNLQRIQFGGNYLEPNSFASSGGGGGDSYQMNITEGIDKRIRRQNYYKTIDAIENITEHFRSDQESQKVNLTAQNSA